MAHLAFGSVSAYYSPPTGFGMSIVDASYCEIMATMEAKGQKGVTPRWHCRSVADKCMTLHDIIDLSLVGRGPRELYDVATITARLVLVLILAICRCCHTLVEQPRSSLMPWFGPFVDLARQLANLLGLPWTNTRMWMGTWGSLTPKPSVLFGTAPWSAGLYQKFTKAQREKLKKRLLKKGGALVKTYKDKHGKKRVQGTKALKSSQVYPKRYGKQVARLHLDHIVAWTLMRA
ncbi:unnamed protein product [Durusdinium trenchii]|uniref:Uncharacterized protein n=1 Tax=Durusdinium trenchii TaxID=1381693 RepID=A0ABP0HA73_9DINO